MANDISDPVPEFGGVPGWVHKDEEDDTGWITPANLESTADSEKQKTVEKKVVCVGCVTSDFAMQNVLLQMGLHVVSVDGMQIRQIKTFALKCSSCLRITHATEKKFCGGCGYPTLFKITVMVNSDGKLHYRMPRNQRVVTRGTVFPLPTPKMGRVDNIVLTEDQKELHRKQSSKKEFSVFSDTYVAGDSPFQQTEHKVNAKKGFGMKQATVVIGAGRRNPNEVRKNTGNRKNKKR